MALRSQVQGRTTSYNRKGSSCTLRGDQCTHGDGAIIRLNYRCIRSDNNRYNWLSLDKTKNASTHTTKTCNVAAQTYKFCLLHVTNSIHNKGEERDSTNFRESLFVRMSGDGCDRRTVASHQRRENLPPPGGYPV